MNTEEVATKLVELCRKGEWRKALEELYAKEIVSVEAHEMENMPAEMRGIDQVRGKTDWWEKNMEVHSAKVGGPFVARDKFVVQFDIDVTEKGSNKRMQMSEVGIYTSRGRNFCRLLKRKNRGGAMDVNMGHVDLRKDCTGRKVDKE